jgi:hypothetical protein
MIIARSSFAAIASGTKGDAGQKTSYAKSIGILKKSVSGN